MESRARKSLSGARTALFLLLGINLFNYIDRQILAALEPDIRATFFAADDVHAMTKTGLLGDAFFVTYMISAPILGFLADRFSRWIIVGSAVILWSLASGGSGLAATFAILFATRDFGRNWRRRLRPRCANDLVRSLPDRNAGSHHGDFLRSDSSWQRAWLCNWRISRCSSGLALGILSCYAAGFVAWPFVFLATRSARCCGSSGTEIIAPQRTRLPEPVPHTLLSHQLHRA